MALNEKCDGVVCLGKALFDRGKSKLDVTQNKHWLAQYLFSSLGKKVLVRFLV